MTKAEYNNFKRLINLKKNNKIQEEDEKVFNDLCEKVSKIKNPTNLLDRLLFLALQCNGNEECNNASYAIIFEILQYQDKLKKINITGKKNGKNKTP